MKKNVTMKDVANYVGVSTATISYYLNGHYENMSEEVRLRIEAAVAELGYKPNILARNLRTKKTRLIGVVTSGIRGNLGFLGLNGNCEYLNSMGYDTILHISNESLQKEREHIRRCIASGCEGIIVVPSVRENMQYLREVHESGVPIVVQSRYDKMLWPYDAVSLDYRCVERLMRHMAEKGYERIALFIDSTHHAVLTASTNKRLRCQSFLETTQSLFHVSGEDLVYYGIKDTVATGQALEDFAAKFPTKKKAVFAINTPVIMNSYRMIQQKKLHEVALCGYSGEDYAELMTPRPDILTQPLREIGELAAKLMLRRLQEPDAPVKGILVPSQLIDSNGNCL